MDSDICCSDVRRLLRAYTEDDLTESSRLSIVSHIATCDSCRYDLLSALRERHLLDPLGVVSEQCSIHISSATADQERLTPGSSSVIEVYTIFAAAFGLLSWLLPSGYLSPGILILRFSLSGFAAMAFLELIRLTRRVAQA